MTTATATSPTGGRRTARIPPGLLLAALLLVLHVLLDQPASAIREKTYDLYQQAEPRPAGPWPAVIVAIDEESLARFGRWPWDRRRMALLVDRIAAAGPAALGLDLLFPEPDTGAGGAEGDAALAAALGRARAVLAISLGDTATTSRVEPKAGFAVVGNPPEDLPGHPGLTASLTAMNDAAGGLGVIRGAADGDGVLRRLPLLWLQSSDAGPVLWPGLSLELVRVAMGADTIAVRMNPRGFEALKMGDLVVPLGAEGAVRLWERRDNAPIVPAASVIDGDPAATAALAGRIVILALNAVGLDQFHITPARAPRLGSEVHALLADQILSGQFPSEPGWARLAERGWFSLAALALVLGFGLAGRRAWLAAAGVGLLAAAPCLAGLLLFRDGLLIDAVQPAAGILLVAGAEAWGRYRASERRRAALARQFAQFLSPAVVAELARSDAEARLGGDRRDITILLIDIRGFTTLSERLEPRDLITVVNHFLATATEEILLSDGTIDKFMGDAVLSFWNAPVRQADHAARALAAARGVLQRISAANAGLEARGLPPLSIGCALETGPCTVGNVGSLRRIEYTVIGPAVNRAARLDGITKELGVPLVIGPGFAAASPEPLVEAGRFELRGFREPQPVFTTAEHAGRLARRQD